MAMIFGSFVPEGTPKDHVFRVPVYTVEGICAKHKINGKQFEKLRREVSNKKLSTNLLMYPDGPQYDILLFLVATTR